MNLKKLDSIIKEATDNALQAYWDLHKKLSKESYNNNSEQLKDMRRLGKIAEKIYHLKKSLQIIE